MSETTSEAALDGLLREKAVVVVCGSGGVGKTTLSAGLALRAARLGRRAIVCTIDPARRLADSLGIDLEQERIAEIPLGDGAVGRLHATMLDSKRTFDRLVQRHAASPEAAERILANRIYQRISSQVSGVQEYMAMETLHELHEGGEYDLIVLDTPPTRHAIDFLTAPERMAKILDDSSLQWILRPESVPRRFTFGFMRKGMEKVAKKIDELMGMQVLHDLAEFFRAFDGMYAGFGERSRAVQALFRDDRTAFVVATSPEENPLREAAFLAVRMRDESLPCSAFIVNRYHAPLLAGEEREALTQALAAFEGDRAADPGLSELLAALQRHEAIAAADRDRIAARLDHHRAGATLCLVPRFAEAVTTLDGLDAVARTMEAESDGRDT